MASVNKVILIGNLGGDPEIRFTPGGQAVANFSLATTDRWSNKNSGQPEERTEWHKIVVWGKLAELSKEYLAKGRPVYVEGRLQTRQWEDKQGQKRYTTEIVGEKIQFLGSAPGKAQGQGRANEGMHADAPVATSAQSGPPAFDSDEDIPF